MKCVKCKKTIPEESLFCMYCGKKQHESTQNTKSRGNGTGSVFKIKSGKWRAAYTIGSNNDGKLIRKTKSTFKTKREALDFLDEIKSPFKKPAFFSVFDAYNCITPKLEKLSDKRQLCYKSAYKHLKSIEHRNISELSLSELQSVIDSIPGGFYSKRYVKDLLSKIYNYAFIDGKIDRNISPYIELPPNIKTKEVATFTKQEVELLWKSWENGETFAGYILILIYCAIRTGELRSIQSKNVDFINHVMYGGIKTNKGKYAPIFMIDRIEPVIKYFVDKNPESALFPGYDVEFYRKWRDFKLRIGFRDELTPYSGRHSCATILANSGIPEAVIMAIMRHEKYDTTLSYTHIDIKGTLAMLQSAIDKEL
jgi:integrase